MMRRKRQAGMSAIEFLIAGIITTIIGGGFVVTFVVYYSWWENTSNTNAANAYARVAVDNVADRLRNATQYPTAANAVIGDATATSVTYYSDSTGKTTTLWLDTASSPYKLKKTDNASTGQATLPALSTLLASGTTVTLLPSVTSLTFTYCTPPAGNYTADRSLWVTTVNPNFPTLLELPAIGAVEVSIQTSNNGYQRPLKSFVRLRGSPKKNSL